MNAGELRANRPSTRSSGGEQDGQQAAAFAELAVESIAAERAGGGSRKRVATWTDGPDGRTL